MGAMACPMAGCVNLQSDDMNCGFCGVSCGADRSCVAGACECAMGTTMCGATCINLQTDTSNCGACGIRCPANQMCVAGACRLSCANPNSICVANNVMSCVNLQTDLANCGACGTPCAVANGTPSCGNGRCSVGLCNAGFANCDMNAVNGCEVSTNANVSNCGGCGVVCPVRANANQSCAAGACGFSCSAGFDNCNANPADGCEVNLSNSVASCGRCGNVCAVANGTPGCANSACTVASCNAGFGNCDANVANGCEANTQTDVANCGGCGVRCLAGQSCQAGVCRVIAGGGYSPVGPQVNVPLATVTGGGWTECYRDLFSNGATTLATIQARCSGAEVMVACRTTGSATLQLLAQAPRADVFFNTGDGNNIVRNSNGTDWYYSASTSFGYASPGLGVSRNSCDTLNTSPGTRFCAHTSAGNINGGYRCGADLALNGSAAFERVLYHRTGYRPVGPQNNVPVATVTAGGWVECYRDLYNNSATAMATIQALCSRPNVMVACRPTGNATLSLLAQAPRADVFFDTAMGNVLHVANGTGWYYSSVYSMGFTLAAETVSRNSCDTANTNPNSRLCFHTGGGNINSGYRCGADTTLNGSVAYERVFYHSN